MSSPQFPFSEPIIDPEILESIKALPTEDTLPCDDGEPRETPRHREQMTILIDSLKAHWADRTGYYVGGNMFVYYDPYHPQRFRGPDFFLVLDVEERERKSWVVWFEGMHFPEIIIELLSVGAESLDVFPTFDLLIGTQFLGLKYPCRRFGPPWEEKSAQIEWPRRLRW